MNIIINISCVGISTCISQILFSNFWSFLIFLWNIFLAADKVYPLWIIKNEKHQKAKNSKEKKVCAQNWVHLSQWKTMIDVYWLSDTSMAVSANPRSGRITIHETKRNLVQYHSINISTLVVGVLWVIANEILATLRENLSQWICEQFWSKRSPDSQKPWYTTMTHGTINHTQEIYWENTTGRLPLFRWEAQEKWVGGRLCIV